MGRNKPISFSPSRVLFAQDDPDLGGYLYSGSPELLTNGDYIRLYHVATNTSLAVSGHSAVMINKHKLVHAQHYVS